jgi:prepilin-type N-terminal cleavage/methylation domain-containing protein/prepilin-type processing-associated H-X9-DG protein
MAEITFREINTEDMCRLLAQNTRLWRGFTLIELLVVIAVIAILAGMILPVLANAKKRGIRVQCMSNLKQVGTALQMYTDDNEDFLPGPLVAGARASYDKTSSQELIFHVATYLGDPAPSTATVISRVFRCPGYERNAPDLTSLIGRKVFLLNDDADADPLKKVPPFGYPFPPDEAAPLRLTAFDNNLPPASVFAITDVDQSIPILNPAISWWSDLPNKPVHGSVRNQLFFDWHVEAVRWGTY